MGIAGGPGRWLVTLGIGIGGGLALGPLLGTPVPRSPITGASFEAFKLRVTQATGRVRLERPKLGPTVISGGDVLLRPVTIRNVGEGSQVEISLDGARLRFENEGRLLIGVTGARAILTGGRLMVSRPTAFEVFAESYGLRVEGRFFGLWIGPEVQQIFSLKGTIQWSLRSEEERKAEGPVLIQLYPEPKTTPIPDRLEVEVIDTIRRGRGTRIVGSTMVGARVRLRIEDAEAETIADSEGRFVIEVPVRGELDVEARDALGRVARPGMPSPSLQKTIENFTPTERKRSARERPPLRTADASARSSTVDAALRHNAGTVQGRKKSSSPRAGAQRQVDGKEKAARSARPSPPKPRQMPKPAPTKGPTRRSGVPSAVEVEIQGLDRPERLPLEKMEIKPPARPPDAQRP